ncbi:MAG TPA: hypothetical protein VJ464_08140 [Blastocatellia bacterium]|nr:hypothetical protein [Blastocatellia bacterium]
MPVKLMMMWAYAARLHNLFYAIGASPDKPVFSSLRDPALEVADTSDAKAAAARANHWASCVASTFSEIACNNFKLHGTL